MIHLIDKVKNNFTCNQHLISIDFFDMQHLQLLLCPYEIQNANFH